MLGKSEVRVTEIASAVLDAVADFASKGEPNLKLVRIVVLDASMRSTFVDQLNRKLKEAESGLIKHSWKRKSTSLFLLNPLLFSRFSNVFTSF